MTKANITEEYPDTLHNIEIALLSLYQDDSVQLWHKDYGRRGYYNDVSQFLG